MSTKASLFLTNDANEHCDTLSPLFTTDKMTKNEWAMEFVKFKKKIYLYDPRWKLATMLEYKKGDSMIVTSFTGDDFQFAHKLINLSWAWAYFNDHSHEITEEEFFAHILAHLNSLKITDKKFQLI